jgi:hypothetical protein
MANSIVFPDQAAAVANLTALLNVGVGNTINVNALTSSQLWAKLKAAEASAQRQLRVFFGPTEIIPEWTLDLEQTIAAFEAAGTPYAFQSAFDYDPESFMDDRWAFMQLAHTPVQVIRKIWFDVPSPCLMGFAVPDNWIRLDKKYGQLRLIPVTSVASSQMAYGFQLLAGGSAYPLSIQVSYLAGLTNVDGTIVSSFAEYWDDLVDVIYKMAILKILQDAFVPVSSSISADGLSQSSSVSISDYQSVIDSILFGGKGSNGGLYASIHGASGSLMVC